MPIGTAVAGMMADYNEIECGVELYTGMKHDNYDDMKYGVDICKR
jgi:hypothetical protein